MNRILIVTAVEAEAEALRKGLPGGAEAPGVTVLAGGVGAANAAAATARALALALTPDGRDGGGYAGDGRDGRRAGDAGYGAVISAGLGGAFRGRAELGELLLARRVVAADLGAAAPRDAEHPDGFLSLDELGFGSTTAEGGRLPGVEAVVGTILTVNCTTGTDERAEELTRRYPEAVGEAMEGYGVAAAAGLFDLPFAEIRAVSNFIGRREREAWRVGPALAALTEAARPIAEGLQAC